MSTPYIASIQVGKPKTFKVKTTPNLMERICTTGFFKEPVEGQVWLGKTNLSGDGQANLKYHGGPDKAVLAYSAAHYPAWHNEITHIKLPYGAFAENLTIFGLTEASVCIGDKYSIGDAIVHVSQPRQPCWKISYRWQIKDLTERVKSTGRIGWYFRVIKEGYVESGLPVVLLDRPYPQWTVARAYEIMKNRYRDKRSALELASCPLLSEDLRRTLSERRKRMDSVKQCVKKILKYFRVISLVLFY